MEPLTAIPNLIELVHGRLVDAIADGTLAPGERLTQEELAESLAISRQPVSHALQLLKRQGLVVEQGKRGLAVAPIEPKFMRDMYQVRASLDGLASRLAAGRIKSGDASKREVEVLRAALAVGRTFEAEEQIHELIEADVAFHASVYALSGNSAIADTVAERWPHFKRCMGAVYVTLDRRTVIWNEHTEIAEGILAGDAARAEAAAVAHTERAGIDLYQSLKGLHD